MESLGDILAHNMSQVINKDIRNKEDDGFMVFCHSGEMIIKSRIHPWRNNHKGHQMQEIAIKKLQKTIGGEFKKDVFGASELKFDVSSIKSARCKTNPSVFAIDEWVEVICNIKENGTVIVPIELVEAFKKEFPKVSFKGEDNKWEFIEYTGEYPCMCSGDTILKSGNTIIKTKIISFGFKWHLDIPQILEDVNLPNEVFKWDGKVGHCCGGCE